MWGIATTAEFDRWFAGLDDDEREEISVKVELLKVYGPQLRRPHADTMAGSSYANMKELRADTADAVLRIAFAFDPNRTGILLVGGNKAGVSQARFYKQLIASADKLFKKHLDAIGAAKKKGKGK